MNPSRVIYAGTFSKNLAPGLRLGFLIIPVHLVNAFRNVKSKLNIRTSTLEQRAMAYFIADGQLDRHIYRMKNIYRKRRMLLTALLREHFGSDVLILGDEAGMHLQAEFTADKYSSLQWRRATRYGVRVNSIEDYCINKGKHKNKLVLGYGDLEPDEITAGIERLKQFINSSL